MRKSIFLTMTVMLFVGIASLYGQATCDETQNKHKVGVAHSYQVAISDTNTPPLYKGNGLYTWYVTSDTDNFLSKTAFSATTNTKGVYGLVNDYFEITNHTVDVTSSDYDETDKGKKANTTKKITLTWKAEALPQKGNFYLVLNYSENNGTCDVNNVKVLKIDPINTFKLKVEAAKSDGVTYDSGSEESKVCAATVTGAKLINNKVQYVYGETTLYYLITPTGFTGKWKPQITLPDLNGKNTTGGVDGMNRTYKSVEWKQLAGTKNTSYVAFESNYTVPSGDKKTFTADGLAFINDVATDNSNKVLVKVVISNGTYEGLTNEKIELRAQGNMADKSGKAIANVRDVDDNCVDFTGVNGRKDDMIILSRPTVKEAASGEFVTEIH